MLRKCLPLCMLLATVLPAHAGEPSLMCFGNEPSWGVSLERPGAAKLALPDEAPVEYFGMATRLQPPGERLWRGRAGGGNGGELVIFLRDAACSDGMSNVEHPVVARVSLPDGRALVGCCRITASDPGPPAGGGSTGNSMPLEGHVWRLESLPGQDAAALAAVPGGVTIELAAGTLQAFAGCNRMRGGYTVDGDRLKLEPIVGTMMACPPPIMAIEDALRSTLTGTLRYAVDGDRLTLTTGTEAALVFARVPPPVLEGTSWTVTGFNNGRDAVVSPLVGSTLTLAFHEGQITGHAGCNGFRASYTLDGDRLVVGPAATTRKACPGKGVMEQERQYVAALESATTWKIGRDLLDLHRADGGRALTAKRSASQPES